MLHGMVWLNVGCWASVILVLVLFVDFLGQFFSPVSNLPCGSKKIRNSSTDHVDVSDESFMCIVLSKANVSFGFFSSS